jgi:hypothetical protein
MTNVPAEIIKLLVDSLQGHFVWVSCVYPTRCLWSGKGRRVERNACIYGRAIRMERQRIRSMAAKAVVSLYKAAVDEVFRDWGYL